MKIFVRTLSGQIAALEISQMASVEDLRRIVQEKASINKCEQRLVFESHQLEDGRTLADYNISEESTIHLALRLRGGMSHLRASYLKYGPLAEISKEILTQLICRKCYATNPPGAKVCRKRKCGHHPDLRPRRVYGDPKHN